MADEVLVDDAIDTAEEIAEQGGPAAGLDGLSENYSMDYRDSDLETPIDPKQYRQQLESYFTDAEEEAEYANSNGEDEEAAGGDEATDAAGGGAEPETPNPNEFNPQLLHTAQQFGFDETSARSFGTPQALTMALNGMANAFRAGQQSTRGDVASAAGEGADDVTSGGTGEFDAEDELDPEIYPPVLVNQIKALKQEVASLRQSFQAPAQQAFYERFDELTSKAGIEELGTGPINKLQPGNVDARKSLLATFEDMRKRFPRDTFEQLHQRAVAASYPQQIVNNHKKQLSDKRRQRAQGAVGRPSRRPNDSQLNDEQSTLRELEQYRQKMLRENGYED